MIFSKNENSAEARRRCLFRMDTAHKMSTMGAFFQTWREAANIESVDVRLAKSVRVQKLKRFNLKDTVLRISSSVKSFLEHLGTSSFLEHLGGPSFLGHVGRDSVPRGRSTYTPRSDLADGPLVDSIIDMDESKSKNVYAQEVVLGYDSLTKHASSTKDLLNEVQISELFYETRIAAAERMISFMILFHEMVKPLSKVPFIGFDMDRTESRLRVASTPAPVAMHEKLPSCKWEKDGAVSKVTGA